MEHSMTQVICVLFSLNFSKHTPSVLHFAVCRQTVLMAIIVSGEIEDFEWMNDN